jgi:hypothetical protein
MNSIINSWKKYKRKEKLIGKYIFIYNINMNFTDSFGPVIISNNTYSNITYQNISNITIYEDDENGISLVKLIFLSILLLLILLIMITCGSIFMYGVINSCCDNTNNQSYHFRYDSEESISIGDLEEGEKVLGKQKHINYKVVESNLDFVSINSHTKCAICLEKIIRNQKISVLECGHMFHQDCISPWIREKIKYNENITCPLCRCDLENLQMIL